MAWSKTTRISVMLVIDIVFFFVELISGFTVHSLALLADAFHMLNDIISLLVGLWAVSVASKATTDKFSYGWLRAEILGAFFNAVFLIALCVSIILEALQRFINPPEVENPKLILIVGCVGLLSNIVGFFVLGGHGHSHGGGDHSHGEGEGHDHVHDHNDAAAAEEGRAEISEPFGGPNGPAMDFLPHVVMAREGSAANSPETVRRIHFDSSESVPRSETLERATSGASGAGGRERRRASSLKHGRLQSIDDLSLHPASSRRNIIDYIRSNDEDTEESSAEEASLLTDDSAVEDTPLMAGNGHDAGTTHKHAHAPRHSHDKGSSSSHRRQDSAIHEEHHHSNPRPSKKKGGGHGHSHGDMGMNAMILHVIGDLLGNIGVIISALIIWLTPWPGRFYADPAVSLFITAIILSSAIPLTKATSKVLLQATPDQIDIQEVKDDIQALPGVVSCHHVHVWQLSDTKIVASLHVQVAFPITEEGGERYMALAKQARKCLHAYGIHSATIQPEFCLDRKCNHTDDTSVTLDGSSSPRCGNGEPLGCLLECVDDCVGQGCCSVPPSQNGDGSIRSNRSGHSHRDLPKSSHSHDHGHDHDHSHH